jgi:ABC-type uncharacterized transport system permease subunit
MPIEVLPHWLQQVAHFLPSYYFSRLALGSLGYATISPLLSWSVLAGYTVLLLGLCALVFHRAEARA